MRIRGTKPEFWRSERIASVEWEPRLVLKGLESYVDDNGVGKDDLALIVGDLFSRDLIREPSRTLARVSEALTTLSGAGLLHRYQHEGTRLLYVAFWETVQRIDKPGRGRFPRPDGTWNYGDSQIRESVANPREPSRALAPGTGEQGNRGTEEQRNRSSSPRRVEGDFASWYAAYPRKAGRAAAEKAYAAAVKRADPKVLLEGAVRYSQDPNLPEKQFIPHPATWLNQGRWEDEPLPERVGGPVAVPAAAAEPGLSELEEKRREWLSARGVSWEEYLERKDEPGWLDSLKRQAVRHA